jgi:AraC-like DNA-binding protein
MEETVAATVRTVEPGIACQSVETFDVRCRGTDRDGEPDEVAETTQVIVPRSGVFEVTADGHTSVVHPGTALVLTGQTAYSVSHPTSQGDRCTVLVFPPEITDTSLGDSRAPCLRISAAAALRSHLLAVAGDELDAESEAMSFLTELSDRLAHDRADQRRAGPVAHRRASEACAMIAAAPTDRWTLTSIADAVHVSPFHFARQFKAATGETVAEYVVRLRLAVALERLSEGADDLATLARDIGFSSHSHFSSRFRRQFGSTPTAVRSTLTRQRRSEMSKIVTVDRV